MTVSTALVTGATGFLGHTLVKRLQSRGCKVTALVRQARDSNLGLKQIVADIRDPVAVRAALADHRFDVVFHVAAAGVAPSDRDAGSMFAANAAATGTLVQACAANGAQGFVYTGSCSEYEKTDPGTLIREDFGLTRSNLYGASKAAGGLWGTALARSLGLSFCWLRFFGIYGPGEAQDRLIPYLAARLARDEFVDLTPGEQVRDLTYVDDAVDALILAGELTLKGHEGPFNVCSGLGTSVRDVACAVTDALHKPRELLRFGARPYRTDEPMWLVGDPTRFRQVAGYSPRIGLDHGIRLALQTWGTRQ